LKTRLVYALSVLLVLWGCATAPRPKARPAQSEASAPSPASSNSQSLASPALQKETLNMIFFTDDALSNGVRCVDRRIIKKEVVVAPGQGAPGSWTERWTLERCGTTSRYKVDYTSGKKGKAYFTVKKEK
jgi:hypothetical protein